MCKLNGKIGKGEYNICKLGIKRQKMKSKANFYKTLLYA